MGAVCSCRAVEIVGAGRYAGTSHAVTMSRNGRRLLMSGASRVPRSSRSLTICLMMLLIGGGVFSLVHCYGEHAHGKDTSECALCAFACHVAAAFLSVVSFTSLNLVCRCRKRPPVRKTHGTDSPLYLIRAPPLCPQ